MEVGRLESNMAGKKARSQRVVFKATRRVPKRVNVSFTTKRGQRPQHRKR